MGWVLREREGAPSVWAGGVGTMPGAHRESCSCPDPTGPHGMHELPGGHNMIPELNAEEKSWGLLGTGAWGPPKHLGGGVGTAGKVVKLRQSGVPHISNTPWRGLYALSIYRGSNQC